MRGGDLQRANPADEYPDCPRTCAGGAKPTGRSLCDLKSQVIYCNIVLKPYSLHIL